MQNTFEHIDSFVAYSGGELPQLLADCGFCRNNAGGRYCPAGVTLGIQPDIGSGSYWVYQRPGFYNVKIHDFCYKANHMLSFSWPQSLSITWYESISGEELCPYRRLRPGCVQTFVGGTGIYRVLIHKDVPVKSVGVEIEPSYLEEQYPGAMERLMPAFRCVGQTFDFPEMAALLRRIGDYHGDGIAADLYFQEVVAQAVRMVFERWDASLRDGDTQGAINQPHPILKSDLLSLEAAADYISGHYSDELRLEDLAHLACMGTTKFKSSFKRRFGCTVTEYIQQQRMMQARQLLESTELPVYQIAKAVGYRSASRFAELFRKYMGVLPVSYRAAH